MQPSILGPLPSGTPHPSANSANSAAATAAAAAAVSFIPERAPTFARQRASQHSNMANTQHPVQPPSHHNHHRYLRSQHNHNYSHSHSRSAGSDFIHVDRSNNRRMAGKTSSAPSMLISLLSHPDLLILLQLYLFKTFYLAFRILTYSAAPVPLNGNLGARNIPTIVISEE
ncbi:hypothetical protein TWF970_003984 [Orbilia oligospora]|uniref:Uncharacterized protein n=1 Tax=Orbilia oligospora TaxID=2813651 RepID=A0A7C8RAK9_ORBOL|nr:hypothetical protein TWF970_003984 [Orbilia oligospora]